VAYPPLGRNHDRGAHQRYIAKGTLDKQWGHLAAAAVVRLSLAVSGARAALSMLIRVSEGAGAVLLRQSSLADAMWTARSACPLQAVVAPVPATLKRVSPDCKTIY